jgi:hypothetical protein
VIAHRARQKLGFLQIERKRQSNLGGGLIVRMEMEFPCPSTFQIEQLQTWGSTAQLALAFSRIPSRFRTAPWFAANLVRILDR